MDKAAGGAESRFEAGKTVVSDTSSKINAGKATEEETRIMQGVLQKYGYDLGKTGIDGIAGSKTKAAMAQFAEDVESGKLALENFPQSTEEARMAASDFANWLHGIIRGNPYGSGENG